MDLFLFFQTGLRIMYMFGKSNMSTHRYLCWSFKFLLTAPTICLYVAATTRKKYATLILCGICFFIFQLTKLALFVYLQSSLAAARADNFYYPPEWDPSQVYLLTKIVLC
jgi:hypothetical protein